ncbi:MAG: hypothetical protein ACTTKW_03950 [Schwartzia sp. (in: firmicutes)]
MKALKDWLARHKRDMEDEQAIRARLAKESPLIVQEGVRDLEKRDMTVKIRVEDTAALTEENYKRIKACIQFMEKEYGDNHTLSFKVEFSI